MKFGQFPGLQLPRAPGHEVAGVVAGSRREGARRAQPGRGLGAHEFIDATTQDEVAELQQLGGARVILATAPHAKAIEHIMSGLHGRGKLMLVAAAPEPFAIQAFAMLSGKMVHGWPSGTAIDSEDTMNFAAFADVGPQIERFPLEGANEGFAKVMENTIRFRAVLEIGS